MRNKRIDRSEEHMSLARAAARLGADIDVRATPFGPTSAGIAATGGQRPGLRRSR
ncbi:hypothetical protein ACFYOT_28985 [Saccharothrix saharensis]|uniref:hypothetical protein n=1 Tax=Saccharothrix saharensis TaxID=571190 RepID=UPI0036AB753C